MWACTDDFLRASKNNPFDRADSRLYPLHSFEILFRCFSECTEISWRHAWINMAGVCKRCFEIFRVSCRSLCDYASRFSFLSVLNWMYVELLNLLTLYIQSRTVWALSSNVNMKLEKMQNSVVFLARDGLRSLGDYFLIFFMSTFHFYKISMYSL